MGQGGGGGWLGTPMDGVLIRTLSDVLVVLKRSGNY